MSKPTSTLSKFIGLTSLGLLTVPVPQFPSSRARASLGN